MIAIARGDDYTGARRLTVTVTDEAGATVDLTGTTGTFMVKLRKTDADAAAVITKTITLASPQSGGTKGVAYIAIAAADTDDLDAGAYFYEIEGQDSIGVITLAAGRLTITADLIRG